MGDPETDGLFLTLPFQTGAWAVSEAIGAKVLLDTRRQTPDGVARAKPHVAKPRLRAWGLAEMES